MLFSRNKTIYLIM